MDTGAVWVFRLRESSMQTLLIIKDKERSTRAFPWWTITVTLSDGNTINLSAFVGQPYLHAVAAFAIERLCRCAGIGGLRLTRYSLAYELEYIASMFADEHYGKSTKDLQKRVQMIAEYIQEWESLLRWAPEHRGEIRPLAKYVNPISTGVIPIKPNDLITLE